MGASVVSVKYLRFDHGLMIISRMLNFVLVKMDKKLHIHSDKQARFVLQHQSFDNSSKRKQSEALCDKTKLNINEIKT